jgi:hypothetical protein
VKFNGLVRLLQREDRCVFVPLDSTTICIRNCRSNRTAGIAANTNIQTQSAFYKASVLSFSSAPAGEINIAVLSSLK